MSSLKTLSCALAIVATNTAAYNAGPDQQLRFFASCAGRLSALMEHQWTYNTAAVDQTTNDRTAMIDLVSAAMTADAGREMLLLRVEAKHAYAKLLRRVETNNDPADANWARNRSDAIMHECTSVLLR
jgi:hypothetical protein